MAAHVLDLDLEHVLGAALRALEGHVFEEVGGAVVVRGFVAGAGVDPDSDGGGVGPEDAFGGDAEPAGEGCDGGGRCGEEVGGEVLAGGCCGEAA